jgi:hypothetical protein
MLRISPVGWDADHQALAGVPGPQPVLTVNVLFVTGIPFWT